MKINFTHKHDKFIVSGYNKFCFFIRSFIDATGATSASDDDENEFFDAQEGASIASQEDQSFVIKIPLSTHRRNSNQDVTGSSSEGEEGSSETQQVSLYSRVFMK